MKICDICGAPLDGDTIHCVSIGRVKVEDVDDLWLTHEVCSDCAKNLETIFTDDCYHKEFLKQAEEEEKKLIVDLKKQLSAAEAELKVRHIRGSVLCSCNQVGLHVPLNCIPYYPSWDYIFHKTEEEHE